MVAVGHLVHDRLYFPAIFGDDRDGFTDVKPWVSLEAVEGSQMFFGNLIQRSMHTVVDRLFDIGDALEHQAIVLERRSAEWLVARAATVHTITVEVRAIGEVNDRSIFHDAASPFDVVGRP